MKTIKQLSEELKISKEAIYKKIRYQLKDSLEQHITKVNNITHIDTEGEQIIIQSLNKERQEAIQVIIHDDKMTDSMLDEDQAHVAEYINILEEQLKTKDVQIEVQNNHISRLIRQLTNSQVEAQEKQEEETNQEYEVEYFSAMETAATREDRIDQRKSVWRRIFGK